MSNNSWIWSLTESIPSEASAGRVLMDRILVELESRQWHSEDIFAVQLALEEALVNAIKHGNRYDLAKAVHVVCQLAHSRIRIEITDEGPGFDPQSVRDPTAWENLDIPSGRGVMLMRSFMSLVQYNETGNAVVMEKERAAS